MQLIQINCGCRRPRGSWGSSTCRGGCSPPRRTSSSSSPTPPSRLCKVTHDRSDFTRGCIPRSSRRLWRVGALVPDTGIWCPPPNAGALVVLWWCLGALPPKVVSGAKSGGGLVLDTSVWCLWRFGAWTQSSDVRLRTRGWCFGALPPKVDSGAKSGGGSSWGSGSGSGGVGGRGKVVA